MRTRPRGLSQRDPRRTLFHEWFRTTRNHLNSDLKRRLADASLPSLAQPGTPWLSLHPSLAHHGGIGLGSSPVCRWFKVIGRAPPGQWPGTLGQLHSETEHVVPRYYPIPGETRASGASAAGYPSCPFHFQLMDTDQ